MLVETSSCIRYGFKVIAVWAASSLYHHMSIGYKVSSFASLVGKETAAISAKQRLTIHRYHWQSTDTPATVDSNMLVEVSAECRLTYRTKVSTDGLLTWVTCPPTLGQLSVNISTTYWAICQPTVGQYIGRQYWPILDWQMPQAHMICFSFRQAGTMMNSTSLKVHVTIPSPQRKHYY